MSVTFLFPKVVFQFLMYFCALLIELCLLQAFVNLLYSQ